jgi:hypothetical protein
MKHNRSTDRFRIFAFLLALLFTGPSLFAGGKTTFSVQVVINAFSVGSIQNKDFSGETYFESDNELFLVPKLKGSYALGGALGGMVDFESSFIRALSLEAGYSTSDHTYSFMDAESQSTTATIRNIYVTLRTYFFKNRLVLPFIYLGFGGTRLVAKNGSYSYSLPPRVGDATYKGSDYGFGIGAVVRLPAGFLLYAEAGYHFLAMNNVKGVLGTEYEIEAARATYPRFSVGLGWALKLGKS